MPTYTVTAVNIGSFHLGEADKVLTLFSAERGIIRAVAKGARKPGTKMAGRADVLNVNRLFLASGRTFEIITQSESLEAFPELRKDLARLAYGLYYAELTQQFGTGLADESSTYFNYLSTGLALQARTQVDPPWLCLEFELGLLDMLGYRPELTYCVTCRDVLGDYNLGSFDREHGGVVCQRCTVSSRQLVIAEGGNGEVRRPTQESAHITPLVWKNLVLALDRPLLDRQELASRAEQTPFIPSLASAQLRPMKKSQASSQHKPLPQSVAAARRLIQGYIEYRAGKKLKALDLLDQLKTP